MMRCGSISRSPALLMPLKFAGGLFDVSEHRSKYCSRGICAKIRSSVLMSTVKLCSFRHAQKTMGTRAVVHSNQHGEEPKITNEEFMKGTDDNLGSEFNFRME
jgi:hypothetical protein